jgi:hypothetical protein
MEPIDDPQLKKLLREWKVEDAPSSLNERVLGAKQSGWKLLIGGSVRVPVPIVLGFAVLLVVMGAALVRLRPGPASAAPAVSSTINLAEFQPVRDVQVRIIRGTDAKQ